MEKRFLLNYIAEIKKAVKNFISDVNKFKKTIKKFKGGNKLAELRAVANQANKAYNKKPLVLLMDIEYRSKIYS